MKKYWKWLLFPVGVAVAISGYISGRLQSRKTLPGISSVLPEIGNLSRERDEKLVELKVQHQERLKEISEEQQKELEELQDKPIEEVTKWFDRL